MHSKRSKPRSTALLFFLRGDELLRPELGFELFGWQATARTDLETVQCLVADYLIEAAKLAPRWNPQLAQVHERELGRGHRNRATLAVARKLAAYLSAVDKSGKPFEL